MKRVLFSVVITLSLFLSAGCSGSDNSALAPAESTAPEAAVSSIDEEQAKAWKRLQGVAEYSDHRIILTSMPYGESELLLQRDLPRDLELYVRLQGNVVGKQTIKLRSDANGEGGLSVGLLDNALLIEEGDKEEPLFELDLLVFDGGPFVSKAEEERNGKIALAETIIENDHDEARIQEAREELEILNAMQVPGIADGAEPFIPELDIDDQDDRTLRIRLKGNQISVWLDGELVAEDLRVSASAGKNLFLNAAVTHGTERFSQTNLSDDVYDGIFAELNIYDTNGDVLYSYAPLLVEAEQTAVGRFFDKVGSLFHWTYPHREDGES